MSLKINFESTNKILVLTIINLSDIRHLYVLEALRVDFEYISESSARIEDKILKLCTQPINDEFDKIRAFSLLIGDVWGVIDRIRKIELILDLFRPARSFPSYSQIRGVFKTVKKLRDSYQHVNERINTFFIKFGNSVYGDLHWHYRKSLDVPSESILMLSGFTKGDRLISSLEVEDPKDRNKVGVWGVKLIYVDKDAKKTIPHEKVEIDIEQMIVTVNLLIADLESWCFSYLIDNDLITKHNDLWISKKDLKIQQPHLMAIRLTKEGFDNLPLNIDEDSGPEIVKLIFDKFI